MATPIPNFLSGNYTITRSKAGAFVRGRYQQGPTETLMISGSLQPIGSRDIKMLDEGERIQDHYFFFSDQALTINNDKSFQDSDVVIINGETYRVVGVEEWSQQAGFTGIDLPHFRTLLKRRTNQ